jgi:Zn-dependent M16 (insulinase) family peptidase
MQKERDQILNASDADIRKLADLVECALQQQSICVVGSSSAIENNKDIFKVIEDLS